MIVSMITENEESELIIEVPAELGLQPGQQLVWTPLKNGKIMVERVT